MPKNGASKKKGSRPKRATRSFAQPSDDSVSTLGSENRRVFDEGTARNDDNSISSVSEEDGRRRRSIRREAADSHSPIEDPLEPTLLHEPTIFTLPYSKRRFSTHDPTPRTRTLNTTTIPQTIINELNSESVRKWINEQTAIEVSGLSNPAS
jgi:hypothetical protein